MADLDTNGSLAFATSRGGVPDLFGPDGKPSLSASSERMIEPAVGPAERAPTPAPKPAAEPAGEPTVDHDARIAEAERRLAALQSAPPPAPATTVPDHGPRPRRLDFDDPDAYETALVEWAATNGTRRTLAERDRQAGEKAAADRQAAANQALAEAYNARGAKFAATHPDYREISEAPDLAISEAMVAAILHMGDAGPEVAYWLGKHKDEAKRIAALPPGRVAIELGKISARVEVGEPAPRTRAAPTPAPRARATPAARPERGETSQEYMDRRLQELRAERRPGMFGGR